MNAAADIAHTLYHSGPQTRGQLSYRLGLEYDRIDVALETLRDRGLVRRIGWRAGHAVFSHV